MPPHWDTRGRPDVKVARKAPKNRCGWVVYSHHRYEYVRRGGDHGKKPGADTMKVHPVTGEFT